MGIKARPSRAERLQEKEQEAVEAFTAQVKELVREQALERAKEAINKL